MLSERIIGLLQERFGTPLQYPQQCEALAMAIQEATGHSLGTTTLKRMLGFVGGTVNARTSSLDIIARYLGYPDYELLSRDFGEDTDFSDFRQVESIDSIDLEPGEAIKLTYHPDRQLILCYLGDNIYEVTESHGSKLLKGDRLIIAGFYVGFKLLITDVEREGKHLGSYQAAKQGGLVSVEIL